MMASQGEQLETTKFEPTANMSLFKAEMDVDFPTRGSQRSDAVDAMKLAEHIKHHWLHFPMTVGQELLIDFCGMDLSLLVKSIQVYKLEPMLDSEVKESDIAKADLAIMCQASQITLGKKQDSVVKLTNLPKGDVTANIFRPEFSFEKMGIGGLDREISDVFRRAFASRIFPTALLAKMNLKHVKGMLLYGPPGCGKTLIARQIGKMLVGKEPKVVNGPEVLNKYVGQSEENVRNLFKEAEAEYKERGDDSELHVIIFDELDAICKARGSRGDGTGTHDGVVNQLLSKIDGVEALNNILLIGMTNRKDMLDEALLRPGRMEVHIEIGLPDQHGRSQIILIHTAGMREHGILAADVDLEYIAEHTKNFSGAELEGLVKSASSFAMERCIDPNNLTQGALDNIKVTFADFQRALAEVQPAFGVQEDTFEKCLPNGIVDYGATHRHILQTLRLFSNQVRDSDRTPLLSVLLEGPMGSGKTALAATVAVATDFPYIKLISPEDLVGFSEGMKCNKILKFFDDSYKSPLSVIVLDNLERLLEFVSIGPRFSNTVLQLLLVLIKKPPPKGRKLLVIGTTSNARVLDSMELVQSFNATVTVPLLGREEVAAVLTKLEAFNPADIPKAAQAVDEEGIGIKQLLMVVEMARADVDDSGKISYRRFVECLKDCGL